MTGVRFPFYIAEMLAYGLALFLILRNWRRDRSLVNVEALLMIPWIIAELALMTWFMGLVIRMGWHDFPVDPLLAWFSTVVRLTGGVTISVLGMMHLRRKRA